MQSRTRTARAARVLVFVLVAAGCGTESTSGPDGPILDTFPLDVTPVITTAPLISAVPTESPTPMSLADVASPQPAESPAPPSPPPEGAASTPTPKASLPVATAPPAAPLPTPPPTAVPVTASQPAQIANGAEVFTLNCARCHGENGLGSAQYSTTLIGVGGRYSTQGMIAELTSGHPVTFGFADRLSADEIASVVAYVKASFP